MMFNTFAHEVTQNTFGDKLVDWLNVPYRAFLLVGLITLAILLYAAKRLSLSTVGPIEALEPKTKKAPAKRKKK